MAIPSVVASNSSHMFQAIVADENSFVHRTPFHKLNTSAANEFQGSMSSDHLKQSGGSLTEMQLLSGEIAHLRQRLQMEVLANQELEEVIVQLHYCFARVTVKLLLPDDSHCSHHFRVEHVPQMIESTLELLLQLGPTRTDALNRSSASEAYDSVKRTLEVRVLFNNLTYLCIPVLFLQ
jgi:hypothetical protein